MRSERSALPSRFRPPPRDAYTCSCRSVRTRSYLTNTCSPGHNPQRSRSALSAPSASPARSCCSRTTIASTGRSIGTGFHRRSIRTECRCAAERAHDVRALPTPGDMSVSRPWVVPAPHTGPVGAGEKSNGARRRHEVPLGVGTTDNDDRPPLGRPIAQKNRRRPTLPGPCEPSTIGAEGLNCSVRNGKRCFPLAKATGKRRETTPFRSFKTAQRHWVSKNPSSPRPISTGLLQTLPSFQIRPINLVVYQGSYSL
jgi:hypothetical protein